MHDSQHGDLEVARAAAASGIPAVLSTLMQDPMEDVAAELAEADLTMGLNGYCTIADLTPEVLVRIP